MTVVTIHKAKTELSKLIARVEAGEEVIIARGSEPVAELIRPRGKSKIDRQPGRWRGRLAVPPSAFEPLPEEELRLWEGRGEAPA